MGLPVFREPTTVEVKSNVKSDPSALARSTIRRVASVRHRPHNVRPRALPGAARQENDTNNESTRLRRYRDVEVGFLSSQPLPQGGAEPHRQIDFVAAAATAQHLREDRARENLELHLQQQRNEQMPPPHIHMNPAIRAARDRVRTLDEEFARDDLEIQLQQQRNRQLPPPIGQSLYLAHPPHIDGFTINDEIPTALRTVTSLTDQVGGHMRTNLSGRSRNRNTARRGGARAVGGPSRAFQRPISPRMSPPMTAHERSIAPSEEERVQALHAFNHTTTDDTTQPIPLREWHYFGLEGGTNGLGDRQRSTSPDSEARWDTLLTTITPDPSLPSAGSSFASAAASFPNIADSTSTRSTPSMPESSSLGAGHETATPCEDDSGLSTSPDASDTDSEDASDAHSIRQGTIHLHHSDSLRLRRRARNLQQHINGFERHYRSFAEQYGLGYRSDDEARDAIVEMHAILDTLMRRDDGLVDRTGPERERLREQDRRLTHLHLRRQRRGDTATFPEGYAMRPVREIPESSQHQEQQQQLRRQRGGGVTAVAADDENTAMRTMPEVPTLPQQTPNLEGRLTESIDRHYEESIRRRNPEVLRQTAGDARETEVITNYRAELQRRGVRASQERARLMGEEMERARARSGSEHRRGHERL